MFQNTHTTESRIWAYQDGKDARLRNMKITDNPFIGYEADALLKKEWDDGWTSQDLSLANHDYNKMTES